MAIASEQSLADLLSVSHASKADAGERMRLAIVGDGLGWSAPCGGDQSDQFRSRFVPLSILMTP